DDLTGVGRIGEDLLVSRHRGVEAHLPQHLAKGAEASSAEGGAVLQYQHGFGWWLVAPCGRYRLPIELHDWFSLARYANAVPSRTAIFNDPSARDEPQASVCARPRCALARPAAASPAREARGEGRD